MVKTLPNLLTPLEVQELLTKRSKTLRLLTGYKRSTLAKRSGVTESSLKRFETTGQISLKNFLRIVHALGRLDEFSKLLTQPKATTMAELRSNSRLTTPKRGKI